MTTGHITIAAQKVCLRHRIEARRRRVAATDIRRFSAAIIRAVIASPAYQAARTIGVYLDLPGEVRTAALVRRAWRDDKRVCMPVFVRRRGTYAWAWYRPETVLRQGYFNVREPVRPVLVRAVVPDLVIVPGVAFDRQGRRLGRGGGFYDRLLAGMKSSRKTDLVGVTFQCQLIGRVPVTANDRAVDMVITEQGMWCAGRRVGP